MTNGYLNKKLFENRYFIKNKTIFYLKIVIRVLFLLDPSVSDSVSLGSSKHKCPVTRSSVIDERRFFNNFE